MAFIKVTAGNGSVILKNAFADPSTMNMTRFLILGDKNYYVGPAITAGQQAVLKIPMGVNVFGIRLFKGLSGINIDRTLFTLKGSGIVKLQKLITVGGDVFFDTAIKPLPGDIFQIDTDAV